MPHGKICYLEIPEKIEARTQTGEGMGAFAVFTDVVGQRVRIVRPPKRSPDLFVTDRHTSIYTH